MRLVMLGTGTFAVPTLRALYASPHEVAALVTQPAKAAAGRAPRLNPMRQLAEAHGTPVLCFENINSDQALQTLARLAPDLLVVADYGQILAPRTLAVARHGGINLHASLLPRYRGAAPINWAIYHGDSETGVTTIHMTPQVDAGPALLQAKTSIGPDENALELEARLADLGAPLVLKTIELIEHGQLAPIAQDPRLASRAPRLKKSDGQIDWTRTARQIEQQVRAMVSWPKTYTFWRRGGGASLRLILEQVRPVEYSSRQPAEPGTVVAAADERLWVATGEGVLAIERLQPAGKRVLTAGEFLRGYPLTVGDKLGPATDVDEG
jgi:methionyl-tRNA formyltransferase